MRNTIKALALTATGTTVLALVVNLAPMQAAVLVDNGAPNLEAVVPSDPGAMLEAGDNFSLSSGANITKITWSGIYLFGSVPSSDDFSVRLFNIVSGVPDVNPFTTLSGSVSRINSGLQVDPNADLYNYALTLTTPFSIGAGNYLLSIVNNTIANPNDDWAWAISSFSGNAYYRVNASDTWEAFPTELSFAIEGNTTPIPTPALLPGLIGFGLSVWRRRKSSI